jgi:long-chain acyl-CoA synthetase
MTTDTSSPAVPERFQIDGTFGFWEIAERHPDRTAVIDPDGVATTYGALRNTTDRLSHLLRSLGVAPGDAVALLMANTCDWLAVALATSQIGAYLVPLNWHLTANETAYLLTNSQSRVLLAGQAQAALAVASADAANLPASARMGFGAMPGFADVHALLAQQPTTPPAERRAGSTMFYSSGTTGRPKGIRKRPPACAPEALLARTLPRYSDMFGLRAGDETHLAVTPLYHAAPGARAVQTLHLGYRVVLTEKWNAREMLTLVERYRVGVVQLVPILFHRLLQLPKEVRGAHDLSSLKVVIHAAAPCPVETKRRIIEWLGPIVHEYYASSEGGGAYVNSADWLRRPGTVGQPYSFSKIRILDEDGTPQPPNTPGLVYMDDGFDFEYFNDPERTRAARRDGYFTAGDYGYLDEEGWLFICDRRSDLIISGGVNIYPAEIEAVLMAQPGVHDAVVIGLPDAEWGQSVHAIVEPADPAFDEAALRQALAHACAAALASFKRPRQLSFARLPRTDAGKLSRGALKLAFQKGELDRIDRS